MPATIRARCVTRMVNRQYSSIFIQYSKSYTVHTNHERRQYWIKPSVSARTCRATEAAEAIDAWVTDVPCFKRSDVLGKTT